MSYAKGDSNVIKIMETHNLLAECYIAKGESNIAMANLDKVEELYNVFKTPKSKFGAHLYE
jgi:hypothetical protein